MDVPFQREIPKTDLSEYCSVEVLPGGVGTNLILIMSVDAHGNAERLEVTLSKEEMWSLNQFLSKSFTPEVN